ncbi:MAG: hypothetical protein IKO34_11075 [Bacteroidales bacterium]|nr:hypothetical protein [Bacteroidales bacterium]
MKQKPYDAESNDKQSVVAEPALTYGNIEATRVARPVGTSGRMSVEEYFGELRAMVNEYYENLQS